MDAHELVRRHLLLDAAQTFSVYPNPTSADGALEVKLANVATAASYTLRNVLGQTVATKVCSGEAVQVPTAGLRAGTYVLSLQVDGRAPVAQRVVVR